LENLIIIDEERLVINPVEGAYLTAPSVLMVPKKRKTACNKLLFSILKS